MLYGSAESSMQGRGSVLQRQGPNHPSQGLCLQLLVGAIPQQLSADVNLAAANASPENAYLCSSDRTNPKITMQYRDVTAGVFASSYIIPRRAATVVCGQATDKRLGSGYRIIPSSGL
jgi:hypothetical protein